MHVIVPYDETHALKMTEFHGGSAQGIQPGRVAQSVMCLTADTCLTADPGGSEFDTGLVPYFHGD